MSGTPTGTRRARRVDSDDMTQSLRRLNVPELTDADPDESLSSRHVALLICQDSEVKKWGRRWLEREGCDVAISDSRKEDMQCIRSIRHDVIVIECGISDSSGEPLIKRMQSDDVATAPVIALCTSAKDVTVALEAGAYDVVRKPVEWQLLGKRAKRAAKAGEVDTNLNKAKDSLGKALDLAERARQALRSQESFEPLTGLPNKKKFVDLLGRGMRAAERDQNSVAVFVIGFNRFRLVIEALGQSSADLVLTEIGEKLGACLGFVGEMQANTDGLRTSAAANLDQARFALMMTCSGNQDELADLQRRLADTLSHPVQVAGQTIYLSACLGIALYPQDASDVDSLLQRADNAMRDAQSRGGGFQFYCADADAAAARKLKIEHLLHGALNESQLSLQYQPIFSARTGGLSGVEALLRWEQEDGTFIGPEEFVPIAEESGLMSRVGEFVLEQACRQFSRWRDENLDIGLVCVNVSKVQLMDGRFAEVVHRIIETHHIAPQMLELELSERGALSGDYEVINQLHGIKDLGVRLSVDDFGTGDSAIAYLRELPVDVLKIDRSYVAGMESNPKDAAIISAIIALGHSLDMTIVAEGVQSEEQQNALRELGCDELQGFYLSQPVDGRQITKMLRQRDSD